MKRFAFVLVVAMLVVAASATAAFANFGPHGGYVQDTDACAGCHRAHTSFSTLGWTDLQGIDHESALLVSNANTMTEFCYACHGADAPGAATNVELGVFDSGPSSGAVGINPDPSLFQPYETNSSYEATLNGGGFTEAGGSPVMTAHNMSDLGADPTTLIKWGDVNPIGGAANLTPMSSFSCTSCHDPHGSSNYRLLKDNVNGRIVGGYPSGVPDPTVISNEEGYPAGGFAKGMVTDAAYKPNYTTAQYANTAPNGGTISQWCAACHAEYVVTDSAYDYGNYEGDWDGTWAATAADAGDNAAIVNPTRHRHVVDFAVAPGFEDAATRALNVQLLLDPGLPLGMGAGNVPVDDLGAPLTHTDSIYWDTNGYINCLTCHRAHGTEATQAGWGVADIDLTNPSLAPRMIAPGAAGAMPQGVAPNYQGALLRFNNRGVCERCHNK